MKNPANNITEIDIGILAEAPQNSRIHSDEQIAQIAASIEKFGWTIPILVDENHMIIAGHARYRAALTLNMTTAPVMVAEGWSDAQKEAYQITDNRLAETSEWDADILSAQIKRINSVDFDMSFLDMSHFDTELFKPKLDPLTAVKPTTQSDIDKAAAKMGANIAGNGAPVTYDVACPSCGTSFEVEL